MFDPEKFGKAMGEAIKAAVTPLHDEIASLKRQLAERPSLSELVHAEVGKAIAAIPVPRDGKDCDMAAVQEMIAAAVKALPTPKDGKDVDPAAIKALVQEAVAALPKPENGKDGAPGRDGQDGKDGAPGQDGKDGRDGIDGKDGLPGKDGRDGVDGKDGPPGRDGKDGQDGKSFTIADADSLLQEKMARWELDFERRAAATLEKAIDRMPKAKDGRDGKDGADGRDGLGFDDLRCEFDGARTVTLKFVRGDHIKSFDITLPVVIDRGVYKEGAEYSAGDGVTWAGSFWIAQKATSAKPDSKDSGFRLAVKKGRDGRDGRDGIDKTAPVKLEG